MTILDDSAADKRYTDWIGRKRAALKRPTLDCGCPTSGEVSYHLWCDRLACEKHAEDPHDCSEFKGSKSGTERESEAPEAVVEASTPRLAALRPEVHEVLRREVRRQGLTSYDIDGVTYHVDQPVEGVDAIPPPDWQWRDITEYVAGQPVTVGIDPARDGSACIVIARVDVDGQVHVAPLPPLVDAAVEPDLLIEGFTETAPELDWTPTLSMGPSSGPLHCAGCLRDITAAGLCTRCPEPPWAAELRSLFPEPQRTPWWRRKPWRWSR